MNEAVDEDSTGPAVPDRAAAVDAAGPRRRSAEDIPDWMRSIRLRYTVLYSAVLFGLATLLLGSLYLGLWVKLTHNPVQFGQIEVTATDDSGQPVTYRIQSVNLDQFQRLVNQETLHQLRDFSLIALPVLFLASLGVGWMIAGRVLAPIARITDVARDIQATDLSRRIRLHGPEDELKQLADTFDDMLARLAAAFEGQQRFVADASHELRNPLATIRTNIDVALADPGASADDLRHTAVVVKRSSDRMARLVDDMLLIARRQQPGQHRDLVDLPALLAEAAEDFAAQAGRKGIAIERGRSAAVAVTGDRDELKRTVANLLENAVRHTPRDGRVQLACGRESRWAWLSVTDSGPGVAPEHAERVFDRFFRVDKARSRAEGGSGLGLSIVRQIARAHGGEVQLRSRPGEGATFVVWLPLTDTAAGTPPGTGRQAGGDAPTPVAAQGGG